MNKKKTLDINDIRNLEEIKKIIAKCQETGGFGRSWGKRGSEFHGSHIIFIQPDEIVLIIQERKKDGKIHLVHFAKTSETKLGKDISLALKEQGIDFQEQKNVDGD